MRLVCWGLGWLRWGSLLLLSGEVAGRGLKHWVSLGREAGGVGSAVLAVQDSALGC